MLQTADDDALVTLIASATHRLVVIAPALTAPVANAVIERWRMLGAEAVKITLDVDAEVYRLGYGDPEALVALERAGAEVGSTLQMHAGVRIGVVIADDVVLAWAPVPALVEAGPRYPDAPNAILIGVPSAELLSAVGASAETSTGQEIGLDKATLSKIDEVREDLQANPPQKFDVARRVRVFNAAFQFVELTMHGTSMARRTVQIPPHLMGAVDAAMAGRLKTLLNVVHEGHALSGRYLQDERRRLERRCLQVIPGYGYVVLREKKSQLTKEVAELRQRVNDFAALVEEGLGAELSKRVDELVTMLLPRLLDSPPSFWPLKCAQEDRAREIERRLRADLEEAVGTPTRYVGKMQVDLMLKDVTYESLNASDFVRAARKVFPTLSALHVEFDAARAADSAAT